MINSGTVLRFALNLMHGLFVRNGAGEGMFTLMGSNPFTTVSNSLYLHVIVSAGNEDWKHSGIHICIIFSILDTIGASLKVDALCVKPQIAGAENEKWQRCS